MKGYVVCVYKSITNEDKLKEYAVKARAAVEKYKGKFLIRGGKTTTNEGETSPRTVVIEFPSFEIAGSQASAEALPLGKAAFRVIDSSEETPHPNRQTKSTQRARLDLFPIAMAFSSTFLAVAKF